MQMNEDSGQNNQLIFSNQFHTWKIRYIGLKMENIEVILEEPPGYISSKF